MGLFSDLQTLITEHGSAAILRERIALLADQAKALEKQVEDLKTENAELKKNNGELQRKLSAKTLPDEFIEHRGALFKRKPDGSYHLAVYCPHCRKSTSAMVDEFPYACTDKCGWIGSFTPGELNSILKELPK